MNTDIKILATGLGWLGNGVESFTSNVEEIILGAKYEVLVGSYNISTGAMDVLELFNTPLSRGVDVRILINKYNEHHSAVRSYLESLSRKYMGISIYDFTHPDGFDLHAKMIVVDREKAIIGSSNISRRGFFENHELSVMITGNQVSKVASAFDSLVSHNMTRKISM
ncbi:phosphatidylserine/phosphatidylglycerophosphate/cardiolipin synthase-like enzyme [Paenibacillus sp. V4I3]|uniref:phospholipase D-like domain-containing protein n=1 Tax=Paenibacillus sp. V4I3 TaxID=3042305 RepID=UPI00278517D0|nr:phospholipase D family protein [Paenibacillus sp. V4I3]MDQ0878967.1 phosphatidylserine/phosphatidylglycerophosphate/cardiolipin synthase-like enzyme [Paenibacillus sp. V4I3]